MHTETIQMLSTVVTVLNNIETKGKQNLANLAGSIDILDGIIASLRDESKASEPADAES